MDIIELSAIEHQYNLLISNSCINIGLKYKPINKNNYSQSDIKNKLIILTTAVYQLNSDILLLRKSELFSHGALDHMAELTNGLMQRIIYYLENA